MWKLVSTDSRCEGFRFDKKCMYFWTAPKSSLMLSHEHFCSCTVMQEETGALRGWAEVYFFSLDTNIAKQLTFHTTNTQEVDSSLLTQQEKIRPRHARSCDTFHAWLVWLCPEMIHTKCLEMTYKQNIGNPICMVRLFGILSMAEYYGVSNFSWFPAYEFWTSTFWILKRLDSIWIFWNHTEAGIFLADQIHDFTC